MGIPTRILDIIFKTVELRMGHGCFNGSLDNKMEERSWFKRVGNMIKFIKTKNRKNKTLIIIVKFVAYNLNRKEI